MNYKYNEREYAEKIKKNGFQTRFIKYELTILAKYLKELNYNKSKTYGFIYEFCKKYIEGYNDVKYYQIIDSAIMNGRRRDNKLIVVKDLPITNRELKHIDGFDVDDEHKKLLLSLLVKRKIAYEINKIHNGENVEISAYFNGTKKTFREVFNASNINTKGYKIDEMIAKLVELNIVQSIVKGDIVLSYMYDMYETEIEYIDTINKFTKQLEKQEKIHIKYKVDQNDIFYKLNDFDNVGYVFDYYKGDVKIKICEGDGCNSLFKAKSNRQKYCKPCWEKHRKEYERIKKKEYRS